MTFDRTIAMYRRLEDEIVDGFFRGRKVITRDSPIDGGVYLGAHEREAIVVDMGKSRRLRESFKEVRDQATTTEGEFKGLVDRCRVLPVVYELARERLKYSEKKTTDIIDIYHVKDDGKISLDVFLQAGYGVCRHQALFAGVLIERFIKEEYLRGAVSIDRRNIPAGGHCWVRYANQKGKVKILDPTQGVFENLQDAVKKGLTFYRRA